MYQAIWANPLDSKEGTKSSMNYQLMQKEKMFVIGLPIVTSNKDGQFQKEVPPLWEKFFREKIADKINNRKNQNLLAVYTDYQGDYTKPFTYLIACEVTDLNEIPPGLVGKEIAPASFALFTAEGQFPESVAKTWQTIWNSKVKRAYTTDFEVYSADFNPQATPKIKIYIAIE